jgi:hypothetical protein
MSCTSPDFFLKFFWYEVFVKQKKYKRSVYHYSSLATHVKSACLRRSLQSKIETLLLFSSLP